VWVLLVLATVIIEAELIAWCRPLQRWLIRRAAAPLPEPYRDRYTEEWYRELEELPDGPVTRLSWVLWLMLRRGSIAKAHGAATRLSWVLSLVLRQGPKARALAARTQETAEWERLNRLVAMACSTNPTEAYVGVYQLQQSRADWNSDPELRAFVRRALEALTAPAIQAYRRGQTNVVTSPLPSPPPMGGAQ
jgi:hypothetical protein